MEYILLNKYCNNWLIYIYLYYTYHILQTKYNFNFQNENLSQILKKVREGKSVKNLTKHNKYKNINATVEHSKAERLKVCVT